MIKYIIILLMLPVWVSAQTLYVPNGVSGISTSPNGSVGIGTSTPDAAYKLDVRGGGIQVVNTATDGYTFVGRDNAPGNDSYFYHRMTGSFHIIGSNKYNSGTLRNLGFAIGGGDHESDVKMSVLANGNVGIGIAIPRFKLEISANNQLTVGNTHVDNPLEAENNYVRSNFGSNVYWDAQINRWTVSQIGANDFSAMIHPNGGGFSFLTSANSGNVARSLTHQEFMAYERMRITQDGNIGIGTGSPLSGLANKGLHIAQGHHTALLLGNPVVEDHGGIIQTTDNKHRVFLGANLYDDLTASWKSFKPGKGAAGISILADEGTWGTSIDFYCSRNTNELKTRMTINGDGNVGIGTTSPDAMLTVKGDIHTQEVRVDLDVPGPDYVFEKDYNLQSLSEIEAYINENKHLPEVPSAKEMEANGLNLKEMNLLLLKKVEELTLHLIEQQKQIEELKRRSK